MAWVKGQKSANPSGQSPEALSAIRHLRRLLAGSLRDITLDDIKAIYRDKNGNIVKTFLMEYLKLVLHYWPDGFVDPDVKPVNKEIKFSIEIVNPSAKQGARKAGEPAQLVTSSIEIKE